MSDLFKSAFGYFSNNVPREEHEFVGQIVELDNQKFRVKKVIAEGETPSFILFFTKYLLINMGEHLFKIQSIQK